MFLVPLVRTRITLIRPKRREVTTICVRAVGASKNGQLFFKCGNFPAGAHLQLVYAS